MPPEGTQRPPQSLSGSSRGQREIIFEFVPLGGSVKAVAVDVQTGIEVSVVGPAGPSAQRELQRVALMKLQQRLVREGFIKESRKPDASPKSNSGGGSGGGIIV